MFYFIFIIILISTQSDLFCNSKWSVIDSLEISDHGYGTTTKFMSIKTANNRDIMAVANIAGQAPCMIKSQDSGKTWKITFLDTIKGTFYLSAQARDMACPDTNLAIIVCDSGYYFRSVDNGESWVKNRFENKRDGLDIRFWDNKIGIVYQSNVGVTHILQKTTNGGLSWFEISGPKPIHEPGGGYLITKGKGICYYIEVDIIDSMNYFHKSTDYGETWETYPGAKIPPLGFFYFYNENLGFGYGSGHIDWSKPETKYIRKTTDGGRSWKTVLDTTFIPTNSISDMHFCDSLNGIASSLGNVFRTSDGGDNWIVDTSFTYQKFPFSILFLLMLNKHTVLGTASWSWPYIYRYTEDKETSVLDNYVFAEIKIYPNPATNELCFDLPNNVNYNVFRIYDIAGNIVLSGVLNSSGNLLQQNINIECLAKGAYYLILQSKNCYGYSMIIKK